MRTHQAFGAALAFILVSSCGGTTGLLLSMDAENAQGRLKIPDDVDGLHILITDSQATSTVLDKNYALANLGQQFPLSLGIESGSHTPKSVVISVDVLKNAGLVGTSKVSLTFVSGSTVSETIRIIR